MRLADAYHLTNIVSYFFLKSTIKFITIKNAPCRHISQPTSYPTHPSILPQTKNAPIPAHSQTLYKG
jgi:hypothetical protein